ncbi:MAG: 30S ribosome-binding factor RbfA [Phycisphaerae bacterium]
MSYRNKRVAAVVRGIVSDTIANRLSDPRISRLTSVTCVEVTADLEFADVYVSVMGTDGEATTTMKGLQSARGLVQRQIAHQLDIRKCPELRLHLDDGLKIARQTLQQLDEVLPGLPPDTASDESPARPPGATE